jgi:hypothetical protein
MIVPIGHNQPQKNLPRKSVGIRIRRLYNNGRKTVRQPSRVERKTKGSR